MATRAKLSAGDDRRGQRLNALAGGGLGLQRVNQGAIRKQLASPEGVSQQFDRQRPMEVGFLFFEEVEQVLTSMKSFCQSNFSSFR